MFAIQSPAEAPAVLPHILPCQIHHDGPVDGVSQRFWDPRDDQEEAGAATTIAHMRGRRLRGRKLELPPGYEGVLLSKTDNILAGSTGDDDDDEEKEHHMDFDDNEYGDNDNSDDDPGKDHNADHDSHDAPTTILETHGAFSDYIVWDHDQLPATDNTFIKAMTEWIPFAQAIHSTDPPKEA